MYEKLRYRHHWILGQTQTGKTTLLEQSALEDINAGHGVFYLDPHGRNNLLPYIPKHRHKDVIVFDPSDFEYPIAWNPLQSGDAHSAAIFAETLKYAWGYANLSTPQLDQILYNAAVAMQDMPGGTVLALFYLLTSPSYRTEVIGHIKDPVVQSFWTDFNDLSKKDQRELVGSTLNKVQMLVADPRLRNILGQTKSALSFKDIIAQRQILIVNLPLASFGEQKVATIGSLLLSQFSQYIHHNKKPFHIHVDDAFYFQTPYLKTLLASAGRHNISLTLVTQYLSQLRTDLLHAFMGNIGRKTAFRMGFSDSKFLADDFGLRPAEVQLHELSPYQAAIVTPVGAQYLTFQPPSRSRIDSTSKMVKMSRRSHAAQRSQIEPKISKFIERIA